MSSRWTEDEKDLLTTLYNEGCTDKEISEQFTLQSKKKYSCIHQRTAKAIQSYRTRELNLVHVELRPFDRLCLMREALQASK